VKQFWVDIVQTYSAPKQVLARKMADIPGEPHLLAYVVFATILSFLARLPGMIDGNNSGQPLEALVGANFVASIIFAPLFLYALAALTRLASKIFGGKGSWQSARLALFWPLIALQPLLIVAQFLETLALPALVSVGLSWGSAVFFLWLWYSGMQLSEWPEKGEKA
jgi:Yip1-like protein